MCVHDKALYKSTFTFTFTLPYVVRNICYYVVVSGMTGGPPLVTPSRGERHPNEMVTIFVANLYGHWTNDRVERWRGWEW